MTKQEKKLLTDVYKGNVRLCCSYFVTKDFDVARQIFYATSQFMRIFDDFEMYGEQLDPILKSYGIEREAFVDYMK